MRKILIAFGLILVFVWCIAGFYIGSQHMLHNQELDKIAQEGNLLEFWRSTNAWNMRSSCHSHALCFASILILVALVMPDMKLSDKAKTVMGVLLIVGVLSSTIFMWFHILPLVVPGEFLLVAMVFMSFVGILRGLKS